jgi:hypothetical protein
MAMKMTPKMKMFEKSGLDKDKGMKEGSKKDMATDKKQMAKMPAKKKG